MKTSYFSKYKETNGVSIALGTPEWFSGQIEVRLQPTWDMIKGIKTGNISKEFYEKIYYDNILSKLDPNDIYYKYKNSVLLCWERIGEFCHRRIVASWIEKSIGIEVEEYGIMKF